MKRNHGRASRRGWTRQAVGGWVLCVALAMLAVLPLTGQAGTSWSVQGEAFPWLLHAAYAIAPEPSGGLAQAATLNPFADGERQRSFLLGLYFGLIGVLVLYHIVPGLRWRDPSHGWYALFLALTGLFFGLHHGFPALWPPIDGGRYPLLLTTAVMAGLSVSALLFNRAFLLTAGHDRFSERLTLLALAVSVLSLPVALLAGERLSLLSQSLVGLVTAATLVTVGVRATLERFRPAWVAVPAWLLLLAGLVLHLGAYAGVLSHHPWAFHAFQASSVPALLLLSMAQLYRVPRLDHKRQARPHHDKQRRQAGLTDPLTGLYNKRRLPTALGEALAGCRQTGQPLSLIRLDVDHFTAWNHTWGQVAGDQVLEALGKQIRQHVRNQDIACRSGGEQFAIILPNAHAHAAVEIAERLRRAIEDQPLAPIPDQEARVTLSLGIAQLGVEDTPAGLMARSERALQRAKALGRNRCVVDGASTPATS